MKKIIGLFVVLALAVSMLAGCVEPEPRPENGQTAAESAIEQAEQSAAAQESSAQTAETSETSGETSASTEESQPSEYVPFDYSSGLTAKGFLDGITALNYVELCDYIGIKIPADQVAVTEEEIQSEIDNILANYQTTTQVTDRPVEDGDTVNIDYVGSIDGVPFDGGSTGGRGTTVTIGVTSYIPGFLEEVIGKMPGEPFDINVTFPENYHAADLAGKPAVFSTVVNYIEETTTPELTDEWVAEFLKEEEYEINTVAELTDYVKVQLQEPKVRTYINKYLSENSSFKASPGTLITYMNGMMVDYYAYYANAYGLDIDTFLQQYVGVESLDALIEQYSTNVQEDAKATLLMQAIAEDAGIEVTEEDLRSYFEDITGSPDYSSYEEEYGLPYLMQAVLFQKVQDYLFDNAVIE